ncbi:MAG: hypothetical protein OWS74_09170, partial [Firmicutes bacterium]|nr:hypothetical protein [Bacillota bacterium]
LKKSEKHLYTASISLHTAQPLTISIENHANRLLIVRHFSVKKQAPNWIGRVIIGGALIFGSLWMWRRSQSPHIS